VRTSAANAATAAPDASRAPEAPPVDAPPKTAGEPIDLLATAGGSVAKRIGRIVAVLALLGALLWLLLGR